ncbi:hypothetical protein HAV15_004869 [Penicillium sp. str. |nr:hypothetical protein HAV15_004869 [Penicillium sp. str. \
MLYSRELGGGNHRPIVTDVVSDLRPWKSWQRRFGDLLVLAWSPDGTRFAAGAAAKSDEHNMQYNKANNLLLGDLQSNRLKEIQTIGFHGQRHQQLMTPAFHERQQHAVDWQQTLHRF